MAWAKAKTAIVAGAVVLLAAGTTTITVKEIQKSKLDNAWRVRYYRTELLEQAPPQVRILPSKFPPGGVGSVDGAWMGIGQPIQTIIYDAYTHPAWRTKILTKLPLGHFDFIAKLPDGSKPQNVLAALQNEIKRKFDLVSHLEMQNADVLLLAVKNPDANGLKIHDLQIVRSYYRAELNKISLINRPFHELPDYLEGNFQIPIVDGTGIESNVDVTLTWNRKDWEHPNLDGLKQALLDQLGLELVPTNMPIEMLVVEKAP
ncbi:MAG: TIGR03435 family protein [Verrucomicrobiota bacterium]